MILVLITEVLVFNGSGCLKLGETEGDSISLGERQKFEELDRLLLLELLIELLVVEELSVGWIG